MSGRIQEQVGFLLIQVMRGHRGRAAALLGQFGVHVGQEMVLAALWDEDGLSQSALAEQNGVEPPTMTRMIDRMARADLVRRERDTGDARVSRVFLTERGQRLREPVQAAWRTLEREAFFGFTLEERIIIRRLLLQMRANLADG
ncbi:MAG: Transcriptional regulator, MarR family [uncultured Thermomicrobiales bacterium]|uniref:Transcriptional regulator, MarR family n=1 Tax=uncultured Thermomicrobiales bacterium TaxID=1645740 RepID=A0A6J4VBM8_9BACT|nr:MAG: Transcriptional regulator, MarR family [uncultured Thermomicrobiales bacterium]